MAYSDHSCSVGKRVQPSVAAPPTEAKARPRRSRKRGRKKKQTVVDAEGWCHPARMVPPPVVEAGPRLELSNSYHPLAPTSVEEPVKEESGSSSSSQRTEPQTARPTKTLPRTRPGKKVVPAAKQTQPPPTQTESKDSDFQAQQVYNCP